MKTFFPILLMILSISAMAQQSTRSSISYNYLLYVPETVMPEEGYPLMLFLHGAGERGDSLELVKKWGPPSFLDDTADFPFVVVSPQCPAEERWSPMFLEELLDEVESILKTDKRRVYVTGMSMGGYGTWDLAMANPDRFAAIVPVCGKGWSSRACEIKHIPVWVFHGALDDVVPSAFSDDMVKALEACGAKVKYTLYPDVDHFSWVPAYANPELYEWMLQQVKDE